MSAWAVTRDHVDAVVQSLCAAGICEWRDADAVGRELWMENHRSVAYRYGGGVPPLQYRFEGIEAPLDAAVMVRQVHCYVYQSCEHPGWVASRARRWCEELLDHLLSEVGPRPDDWRGDGPWGITSLVEAAGPTRVRRPGAGTAAPAG